MGATVGGRRVKTFDTEALVAHQDRTFPAMEALAYALSSAERTIAYVRRAQRALGETNRELERAANHTEG